MSVCPQCHFAIEPGTVECPVCGVIIALIEEQAELWPAHFLMIP
jgi:RNA polymerase subunit RPABC4/transcription elongation factor Spt4